MKLFYTLLFVVFSLALNAQELAQLSDNKELAMTNFKLYPNPTFDGAVHITTKDNAIKNIVVYDIFGGIVLQDKISSTLLNVSKLTPGIYALQVTENQKVMTRKLVIK
ncbi:Ulvan lyase NLR42 [Arenibacter antarcticus]|uniref:T9SS type A sorting domain-containing protein n=1 Tax=Arenibacter antarcticus TaxID=2040469 RepID=A0ABW5VIC9_9FLAO|nr:T9SS type A sorting domain-containing protein [Arenibacter sp. H213]MCM4166844.1 T9SS C-terminal target domain-containing protein [Arenibacter sp. H213]